MRLKKWMAEMKIMSGAGINHIVGKKTFIEIGPVSIFSPDLGEKKEFPMFRDAGHVLCAIVLFSCTLSLIILPIKCEDTSQQLSHRGLKPMCTRNLSNQVTSPFMTLRWFLITLIGKFKVSIIVYKVSGFWPLSIFLSLFSVVTPPVYL